MQTRAPVGQLTFRTVRDGDRTYLFGLFAETREWQLSHLPLDDAAKRQFLEQQFEARHRSYRMAFPGAEFRIVQLDGADIGQMSVQRQDTDLRLIDLAIAAGWRGRGIGTRILRGLMNQAQGGRVPLRLAVEKTSPANALYRRLGFAAVEDRQTHWEMEWRAATGPAEV